MGAKRKRTAVTGDNLIRQRSLSRSLIRQRSLSRSLIRQHSLSRSLIRQRPADQAYRSIAQLGQNATAESLKMWQKIHKSHRGIHLAEIAELQLEAGMVICAQSEKTLKKLATQKENSEWTKQFNERSEK